MIRKRAMEPKLKSCALKYPVVTITGPRQSGKTILCRKVFRAKKYVSLEHPESREYAQKDPNSFLQEYKWGVIDEIQRVPDLLSYIQTIVDEENKAGVYILTGSQQFEVMSRISQSLAGRTALLRLLPFSFSEIYKKENKIEIDNLLYNGFYPRIFDKKLNPTEAYSFYLMTYVERDIRNLINVKDLSKFERFVKLCAANTGQILNYSRLANDCGINHNTAASWISVLEASFIIYLLRPHHKNFRKRLVKSPKIYFIDTGFAAYLMEITNPAQLRNHHARGALFETFLVSELLKQRYNSGLLPNCYYWRDNVGHEIDLILDFGNMLFPVEIKAGKTLTSDYFKDLDFYRKINSKCKFAGLIYGGSASRLQNNNFITGFKDINMFKAIHDRL